MDYRDLWAKSEPYHPLWCHLLDVAAVCEALLPAFGGVEAIPVSWLLYIVALHDLGKADPLFQCKDLKLAEGLRLKGFTLPLDGEKFRHEARSAMWMQTHLKQKYNWTKFQTPVIMSAICGHHGDFLASARSENDLPGVRAEWEPLRQDLADVVAQVLNVQPWAPTTFEDVSALGMKLSGLIVLADWIASNHEVFRFNNKTFIDDAVSPEAYFEAARLEAKAAVHALRLDVDATTVYPDPLPSFQTMWPHCQPMRPFQQAIERLCSERLPPGLAIIEAPMGEGKTEGTIYLAEHWNRLAGKTGIYIALPTQATSNQMHSRYSAFVGRMKPVSTTPRLIHGMAWLMEEDAPATPAQTFGDEDERQLSREWFRNAKRALISQEGVGTVDQILMAALNVKHGFLRFLGLSAKTLIIDEVHAYDAYMTTLLTCLLKWCRVLQIPVILLSATLSYEQKRTLAEAYGGQSLPAERDAYPLLTFIPWTGAPKAEAITPGQGRKVSLKYHPGLLGNSYGTARLAAESVINGGCACVLVNTVREAQEIYEMLEQMGLPDTELFHARYTALRRQEIEKNVVARFGKEAGQGKNPERPQRAILVATQVVEQSLDVDFDVMISQIAPIDLLLQRSGRLWRHERGLRPTGDEPVLHILLPSLDSFDFGGTGRVYDPKPLLKTLALLSNRDTFSLPMDFRPLIESCYGDLPIPSGIIPEKIMAEAVAKHEAQIEDDRGKAIIHLIPDPDPTDFPFGDQEKPVDEAEEGERASYLHAKTRLGDETCNVLILDRPELINAVRAGVVARGKDSEAWPGNKMLKRLFLQKVGLPKWWFCKLKPAEGFEMFTDVPKWMRQHTGLVMQGEIWKGHDEKGEVIIRNCPKRGLLRETEKD